MKKKPVVPHMEKTVNKIKELLNQSKGMVLDDKLLGSLEEMCEDLGAQLKKREVEAGNLSVKNEENENQKYWKNRFKRKEKYLIT